MSAPYPADLRYTKDHEWARTQGDTIVVGITAFAVDQLGDVTLVDLPAVGATLERGKPFGVVESVKSVSDLYAPLNGTVVAANEELERRPKLLNQDPFGEGWMLIVRPSDADWQANLVTGADVGPAFAAWLASGAYKDRTG